MMVNNNQELIKPSNLIELIQETYNTYNALNSSESYGNCLLQVLKKYHYWPSMQIKKFKNNPYLILLHNTYKRNDTNLFKTLYDQCRSVILDFSMSIGNNIVVTYSNNIPERISDVEYNNHYNQDDICYEAYDGTMISVYNYNNEWYFGTTSCPDANSSRFSHPTKTHGNMFDEILLDIFKNNLNEEDYVNPKNLSKKLRDMFTSNLNPLFAYEFVLVHHENTHIMDYTPELGPNYKCLFHISTKNRVSLTEEYIDNMPLSNYGILYSKKLNAIEAVQYITENNSYGFIVKKYTNDGLKLYKVSTNRIQFREDTDPCNPNIWYNIIMVYMKNRNDYKINDYINYYAPNIEYPIDNNGNNIDPTYLVHTVISNIKDILHNLYIATTNYYPKYKRFKMNKDLDKQLAPIIQFHLAQLRHQQTTIYTETLITPQNVYYYLCHCNNIKNIKTLIQYFATNTGYDITIRSAMCFTVLNNLLS
jgi:hypothetical protein